MSMGVCLRELRKKKRMTLVNLSKISNVAVATLSRMETGKMKGTLESYMNIAKAFDMTLPEFFSEVSRPVTGQTANDYADVFIHSKKSYSSILVKDIFGKKMLPVLVKLEAGGKTQKEELKAGSEKFIYVLEGRIEIIIGNERRILGKGATLYFNASIAHYIRNAGKTGAKCLYTVTPAMR